MNNKMMQFTSTRVVINTLFLMCVAGPVASRADLPPGVTAQEVNTLVALEGGQNAILLLGLSLDAPITNQTVGNWSGTINPNGWSLQLSGTLNGSALSISQTGALDLLGGVVTFETWGSLGGSPFTGDGQMTVTGSGMSLSWVQGLSKGLFGGGVVGLQALAAAGGAVGPVFLASKEAIRRHGEWVDEMYDVTGAMTPIEGLSFDLHSIGTPGTGDPQVTFWIEQDGSYDSGSQIFQATVTIIPEPSTLALLSLGAISLLALKGRTRLSVGS